MASLILMTCGLSCDASLDVTDAAMTARDTPAARPSAALDGTKTYGTFLSSHSSGRCSRILRRRGAEGGKRVARRTAAAGAHARHNGAEDALERLGVRRHDDELGNAAVQRLGRLRLGEDESWPLRAKRGNW